MDDSTYLFKMDAKLFFWELPPARKWQGKKVGEMRIVPYENGTKSQLVFLPSNADSSTMNYCSDLAEEYGGLRAIIHSALAIKRHDKDRLAVVFGKAASMSYVDNKDQARRTAWCVRFSEPWAANNFLFVLNRLVELNGNYRAFIDEQNHEDLFHFGVDDNEDAEDDSDEVDDGEDLLDDDESVYRYPDEPAYYEAAEDKAAEAAEAAATAAAEAAQAAHEEEEGNWHLAVLRGLDEAAAHPVFDSGFRPTYLSDEDEDETGESKQEDSFDVDIETALRCRRMMTHPEGSYIDYGTDDEDEVAESQPLF
jgi:hypothetical protein